MSTRSVTITEDKNGNVYSQYKHWDGYPSNMVPLLTGMIEDFHHNGGEDLRDSIDFNKIEKKSDKLVANISYLLNNDISTFLNIISAN